MGVSEISGMLTNRWDSIPLAFRSSSSSTSAKPDKEEGLRFKQFEDAWAEMAESLPDPESFPLFLEHFEQMLQELADVIDVNASASPIRALYEYITQSAPFTKKTITESNLESLVLGRLQQKHFSHHGG